jgi:hypothetical protein
MALLQELTLFICYNHTTNYYDIVEQIVKSFGCRLFQQGGDWWIMPANQMAASTIYYTKFNLSTGTKTGGTLSNGVTIAPYNGSNIYFINNSQNKITRKGYPVIKVNAPVKFSSDYIANGTFKVNSGGVVTNWTQATTVAVLCPVLVLGHHVEHSRVQLMALALLLEPSTARHNKAVVAVADTLMHPVRDDACGGEEYVVHEVVCFNSVFPCRHFAFSSFRF